MQQTAAARNTSFARTFFEEYRDIDATLIRENLKLSPVQRLRKLHR